MNLIQKMATAGAVAVMGLGLGAASASAYAISGGAYTGTATNAHTFTVAGFYTITCPASGTTFSGTATGSDTTSFTPSYGAPLSCTFFGLPASVTQSGQWQIKVTSGPVSGAYTGEVVIPSGTTTTIEVPAANCTVTVTGGTLGQTFANAGTARNVTPTGVQLSASVSGIAYTASAGCPFTSGSTGVYNTNGNVDIPGITVS